MTEKDLSHIIRGQLIYNIKILVVGIILWGLIILHLNNHIGERESLMPSLEALYHKAQTSVYDILGKDTEQLETKFALQRVYKEISYLIEASNCHDEALLQEVQDHKIAVDNLNFSQAQNNRFNYYRQASNLKNKIEQQCTGGDKNEAISNE